MSIGEVCKHLGCSRPFFIDRERGIKDFTELILIALWDFYEFREPTHPRFEGQKTIKELRSEFYA